MISQQLLSAELASLVAAFQADCVTNNTQVIGNKLQPIYEKLIYFKRKSALAERMVTDLIEAKKEIAKPESNDDEGNNYTPQLRDMFAMHIAQGWLSSCGNAGGFIFPSSETAKRCYALADAMMEARKT